MFIKNFRKISYGLIMMMLTTSLLGCGEGASWEVLHPLSQDDEVYTFYGEAKWKGYLEDNLVQEVDFREWKGTGKKYHSESDIKIDKNLYEQYYGEPVAGEVIEGEWVKLREEGTYTEEELIIYMSHTDEYLIKDITLVDEVNPTVLLGINEVFNKGGLKDYAMSTIGKLGKEYDLMIEDNIKINGWLTQHIIATPKNKQLDEVKEIWIDQTTWLIAKSRIRSGNYMEEFEYSKVQLNPKIDESIFEIDISEEATISYIDNKLAKINEETPLIEGCKRLETPVFYLEEMEGIKLESCYYIESINEEMGRVELTYHLADDREVIIQCRAASFLDEQVRLAYEQVIVQDKQAVYREVGSGKIIQFIREGTLCSIYVKNSEMTKEELIEVADHLVMMDSQ